ncbi:glycosyltransferase domain-containing protein [Rhodosalinus sp. 5P4]|uniref:glycosyltransferase domain-containing protein n=1 Tax=Rhodosalinus sp. 5P4 TaxID=3239196 RepID=UPI003525CC31
MDDLVQAEGSWDDRTGNVDAGDLEEAFRATGLFDESFYLSINLDVRRAGVDPFQHFCRNGFAEGRDPHPAVDLLHCRWVHSLDHCGEMDFRAFLGLVSEVAQSPLTTSMWSPSPLVCPAWLASEDISAPSFARLLDENVSRHFFLHPALRDVATLEGVNTVGDVVRSLRAGALVDCARFDLSKYAQEHRDLRQAGMSPYGAFRYAFSFGLVENRFKYLGARPRSDASVDQRFLEVIALLLSREAAGRFHGANERIASLSVDEPLRIVPLGEDGEEAGRDSALPDARSIADLRQLQTAIDVRPVALCVPWIRSVEKREEPTDRDLVAGRHGLPMTRRVVYSVSLGNYDADPPRPPAGMDDTLYVLITDMRFLSPGSEWHIVRPVFGERDTKRLCLWYKTHPHVLFPWAETTVWMDGNIACHKGAAAVLTAHSALSEVATFSHPDRSCVYAEAEAVKALGLDHSTVVDDVVQRLKAEGMPANWGLYETNVLLLQASDLAVRAFLDSWWTSIATGSRRDQLSFTPAAWRGNISIAPLDGDGSAAHSRFFSKEPHRNSRGRFVNHA